MNTLGFLFDDEVGTRIGHYVVEGSLGGGGMGVVYAARDALSGHRVALKVVRADSGAARAARHARLQLLREAWILSRIQHPNVVRLLEVGTAREVVFMAMALVEGTDLFAWLRGAHSWREIVEVFATAGRGLAAVHDVGVVHRDFKPSNVLVGHDGSVCLTDFGLAVPAGEGEAVEGFVIGTRKYMAPEHRDGLRASRLEDQFSFCAALEEGLSAFRSSGGGSGGPPEQLWQALHRGTRIDPKERYTSLRELLDVLTEVLRTGHSTVEEQPRTDSRRMQTGPDPQSESTAVVAPVLRSRG